MSTDREINIWLYTSKGQIIFQRQARDKDTFPGLLDATAGGHVEIGEDWLDAAKKELLEETGLVLDLDKLKFIDQVEVDVLDPKTGNRNHALQRVYAYLFDNPLRYLQVETGKAEGFVAWDIDHLLHLSAEDQQQFIFPLVKSVYPRIFMEIQELIK